MTTQIETTEPIRVALFDATEPGPMTFLGWLTMGAFSEYAQAPLDSDIAKKVLDGLNRDLWVVVTWTEATPLADTPMAEVIDVIAVHKPARGGSDIAIEFSRPSSAPAPKQNEADLICIIFPFLKRCQ